MTVRVSRGLGAAAGLVAAALCAAACGSDNNGASAAGASGAGSAAGGALAAASCSSAQLTGAGSSFQAPMQQQWSADYLGICSGTRVNYNSVGSGAGIQQFGQGTIDYAGSDVTMQPAEQAAADQRCDAKPAIHIPVTAGGIAVTYNLDGVDQLRFSPDTLADIFSGKVKQWNDPEIVADNPGVALPATAVSVFYRSDSSGTNAVFTEYLASVSTTWTVGSGKTVTWPVGQGAKGNEGVSAGVSQTKGGITYTEQAFAQEKKLPVAQIKNSGGTYVALTADTVSTALKAATVTGTGGDLSMKVDYKPTDAGAYPISTVTYVIACSAYPASTGAAKVEALKGYLTYAVTDGQQQAGTLGFSPLPTELQAKAKAAIAAIS